MTAETNGSKRPPTALELGTSIQALMRLESALLDLYLGGGFEIRAIPDEANEVSKFIVTRQGKELYWFNMRWRDTNPFDESGLEKEE